MPTFPFDKSLSARVASSCHQPAAGGTPHTRTTPFRPLYLSHLPQGDSLVLKENILGFLIGAGIGLLVLLILLLMTVFTVEQQTAAVIERFGKFSRVARSGLNFKIPIVETVAGRINLRVQQLEVPVETKTFDNVFVHTSVAVQFLVIPDRVYDAFYRLDRPSVQITSYVFDVVRARVPKMRLDDVFEHKDEIAVAVKAELSDQMADFGYQFVQTLVTDLEPDQRVKDSMNEINAARRMREAARERGEADKIIQVKAAEGEAESKALQGKGIADQRRAIIDGLRDSVDQFQNAIGGTSAESVMQLVLMTQHYDTMKEIGASARTNTIFVPYTPGGMEELGSQMRNALLAANAGDVDNNPAP